MPRLIGFSLVLFIVFSVMSILEQAAIASGILKVTEKPNLQAVDKPEDEPASMSKVPITLRSQSAFSDSIEDFLVNDDSTGGSIEQGKPSIAVALSGEFVITWQEYRNDNWDIYAARYDSSGVLLDSIFRVNDNSGFSSQHSPAIAIDDSANFVITWQDGRINSGGDIYAQRYSSPGLPIGSNFKVNDDTVIFWAHGSPAVAMDGSGNFVITWEDDYSSDIHAQRYNSSGEPLGSSFQVNDNHGTAYWSFPAIAMDVSSGFVITWIDERNGNNDIYAQRYDSSGTALGSNFKVNDDTGSSYQRFPATAKYSAGSFIITWEDYRNGRANIYTQRYNSTGTPLDSNFKVNDDIGYAQDGFPAIAANTSGNFVVTWKDERNGTFNPDIYAQRYDSSGNPVGSNFRVNDDAGSAYQYSPAIGMSGSSNFIATWEDHRNDSEDVYAQRYDWSGAPLDSNFRVSHDGGTADQSDPAIATDGSGNFVITWADQRNGNWDIFAQRYNTSHGPIGSNFKVNAHAGYAWENSPAIVVAGSGIFVITWTGEIDDIYAQIYDSTGVPLGSNFTVNDDIGYATQGSPAIAMDGSGNFVITWEDFRNGDKDIYAQRYNGSGVPVDSNFKVNDLGEYTWENTPAIAMDGPGKFVITWEDDYGDIYAQRYDSLAVPIGSNFKVNYDVGSAHLLPVIAIDGSGNFLIAWLDDRNGPYDIYAQIYSSFGVPVGTNFRISDDTGAFCRWSPSIATDRAGSFIVSWEDYRGDYAGDIYAQRCDSLGNSVGYNQLVPDVKYVSFGQVQPRVAANSSKIYFTWQDNRRAKGWDIYAKVVDWNWAGCSAIPGDANANGNYSLGDIIATVNYYFNKPGCSPQPLCWLSNLLCRGDWNGSGNITLGDIIQGVNYYFNKPGGPWNALPSGACCLPVP